MFGAKRTRAASTFDRKRIVSLAHSANIESEPCREVIGMLNTHYEKPHALSVWLNAERREA